MQVMMVWIWAFMATYLGGTFKHVHAGAMQERGCEEGAKVRKQMLVNADGTQVEYRDCEEGGRVRKQIVVNADGTVTQSEGKASPHSRMEVRTHVVNADGVEPQQMSEAPEELLEIEKSGMSRKSVNIDNPDKPNALVGVKKLEIPEALVTIHGLRSKNERQRPPNRSLDEPVKSLFPAGDKMQGHPETMKKQTAGVGLEISSASAAASTEASATGVAIIPPPPPMEAKGDKPPFFRKPSKKDLKYIFLLIGVVVCILFLSSQLSPAREHTGGGRQQSERVQADTGAGFQQSESAQADAGGGSQQSESAQEEKSESAQADTRGGLQQSESAQEEKSESAQADAGGGLQQSESAQEENRS